VLLCVRYGIDTDVWAVVDVLHEHGSLLVKWEGSLVMVLVDGGEQAAGDGRIHFLASHGVRRASFLVGLVLLLSDRGCAVSSSSSSSSSSSGTGTGTAQGTPVFFFFFYSKLTKKKHKD